MADHWCIAATDYTATDAWVVHISEGAIIDLGFDFPGQGLEDYDLSIEWLEDHPPGLYRLTLCDFHNDGDVRIIKIECLFVYPPTTTETVAIDSVASSIVTDYIAIARGLRRISDQRRS